MLFCVPSCLQRNGTACWSFWLYRLIALAMTVAVSDSRAAVLVYKAGLELGCPDVIPDDAFRRLRVTQSDTVHRAAAAVFLRSDKLTYNKQTPWPLVRKRTIPTERPPLVGEI
jgi:hypothetical protein